MRGLAIEVGVEDVALLGSERVAKAIGLASTAMVMARMFF
jgi:hypothetical protein